MEIAHRCWAKESSHTTRSPAVLRCWGSAAGLGLSVALFCIFTYISRNVTQTRKLKEKRKENLFNLLMIPKVSILKMRKLLQLKMYSFLSSRWGMTFCVVGLFVTLNTFFQIVQLLVSRESMDHIIFYISLCSYLYPSYTFKHPHSSFIIKYSHFLIFLS